MRHMLRLFFHTPMALLAACSVLAEESGSTTKKHEVDKGNVVSKLSGYEWKVEGHMNYGEKCEAFIENLENNPEKIETIRSVVQATSWDDDDLQKYIKPCEKSKLIFQEKKRKMYLGNGEYIWKGMGVYYRSENIFEVWPITEDLYVLYTGPRYKVDSTSELGEEGTKEKKYVYSGDFHFIESKSCRIKKTVPENPVAQFTDSFKKGLSVVILYKNEKYLLIGRALDSEGALQLFLKPVIETEKSVQSCSAITK